MSPFPMRETGTQRQESRMASPLTRLIIPSTRIVDLAGVIAPGAKLDVIGIRPGEKLHEVLIHEDEARNTVEMDEMFVVQPATSLWFGLEWQAKGRSLPEDFRYGSETNPQTLTPDEIRELIERYEETAALES